MVSWCRARRRLDSIAVPVTLGVWSSAPPLPLSTSSFTFVQTVGQAAPVYQMAQVDSGSVPLPFTILNGTNWRNLVDHFNALVPTPIQVGVVGSVSASPGDYDGSFTIQSPGNSVNVPVTFLASRGRLRRRCFHRS